MDTRQMKGLQIAQNSRIRKTNNCWIVPSQTGSGRTYKVRMDGHEPTCTCPDCELRRTKRCKHIIAIEFLMKQETDMEGVTTTTKTMKVTYSQDWKSYTTAQNNEVKLFDNLLSELAKNVPEPTQIMGRPRLSLQEQVFCAIQKVYSQMSSRRAYSLYRNAQERQQIGRTPNYNAINKLLNREDITPILNRLLILSALPLKDVETQFAQDSSGFMTSQFGQFVVVKYGLLKRHKWVKAHILVGTKTNVIANARITSEYEPDSQYFKPIVMEAHQSGFEMQEISADKAYLSRENCDIAKEVGATPYIPFKKNSTGRAGRSDTWKKMYHLFQFNRDEFLQHYHARSNVETVFMSVKTKFGDKLKSKKFTAQKNELLCKFIAYNIVVLVHEMYELGIEPNF